MNNVIEITVKYAFIPWVWDTAFYHGFLCVRTRDIPNLFLDWGNFLQIDPTSNKKRFTVCLHDWFLQEIISHKHKKYMLVDYDDINPKSSWILQFALF